MLSYAIRRLFQFVPTILAISLIMFLLLNVLPGNAALMAQGSKGQMVDRQYIERMQKRWGLDKPLYLRYLVYLRDMCTGNLGVSFLRDEKVTTLLSSRIWPTLKLATASLIIALFVGIPLGFYSALHQSSWLDSFSMIGAVSGVSIPQFWLGLLLMYFLSVKVRLFPTFGYGNGSLKNLILPAVTLGVGYIALLARITRAAVVEVMETHFVRTAHAKGLPEWWVNWRHIFRNTLVLILTTAGLQFGSLMGQTVVVEKIFSWPGIGSLLVDSIFQRDIPVSQGCILFIILVFLLVNFLVDLLYVVIDPRIDYN